MSDPSDKALVVAAVIEAPMSTEHELTRSEVLAAIDDEIEHLEEEGTRPGWSVWALQGSAATLVWLGLTEFAGKFSPSNVAEVFICAVMLQASVVWMWNRIRDSGFPEDTRLRFRYLIDEYSGDRLEMVFELLKAALLWAIYWHIADIFRVPSFALFWVLRFVLSATMLVFSFLKIPTASGNHPWSSRFGMVLTPVRGVWLLFLSVQIVENIIVSKQRFVLAEFRLGVILATILYLIEICTEGNKSRPTIGKLKQIRRRLAFGGLPAAKALLEARRIVDGFTTFEMLENEKTAVLAIIEAIQSETSKVVAKIDTLKNVFGDLDVQGICDKRQKDMFEVAMAGVESCHTDVDKLIARLEDQKTEVKRLAVSSAKLVGANPNAKIDVKKIHSEIRIAIDGLAKRMDEMIQRRGKMLVIKDRVLKRINDGKM